LRARPRKSYNQEEYSGQTGEPASPELGD
jgi:hypothetical protein